MYRFIFTIDGQRCSETLWRQTPLQQKSANSKVIQVLLLCPSILFLLFQERKKYQGEINV